MRVTDQDLVMDLLYTTYYPVQERDQAVQKRAYRLLAYILRERADFAHANFQSILDALLAGLNAPSSQARIMSETGLEMGH